MTHITIETYCKSCKEIVDADVLHMRIKNRYQWLNGLEVRYKCSECYAIIDKKLEIKDLNNSDGFGFL